MKREILQSSFSRRLIYSFNYENTNSFINEIVYNKKLKKICEYLNQSKLNYLKHWMKIVYKRDCIKNNKEKLIKYYGKQGDIIIADVEGWHKAKKVTQSERNTLQVLFISTLSNKINEFFNFGTYLK